MDFTPPRPQLTGNVTKQRTISLTRYVSSVGILWGSPAEGGLVGILWGRPRAAAGRSASLPPLEGSGDQSRPRLLTVTRDQAAHEPNLPPNICSCSSASAGGFRGAEQPAMVARWPADGPSSRGFSRP